MLSTRAAISASSPKNWYLYPHSIIKRVPGFWLFNSNTCFSKGVCLISPPFWEVAFAAADVPRNRLAGDSSISGLLLSRLEATGFFAAALGARYAEERGLAGSSLTLLLLVLLEGVVSLSTTRVKNLEIIFEPPASFYFLSCRKKTTTKNQKSWVELYF